ncbi:MAG: PEGA domain-containing protein [bacterium]|nr:PEGA domain-containing protein [bacterium]
MKWMNRSLLGGIAVLSAVVSMEARAEVVKVAADPVSVKLQDGSELTIAANYDVDLKVQEPQHPQPRKMAIFIRKNEIQEGNKTIRIATDSFVTNVAAMVSSEAIEIMDYRDVVAAIEPQLEADGTTMDQHLLANSSYTMLARNLGVDYVLMLSLDNYSTVTKKLRDARFGKAVDADGTTFQTLIHRLSASYRVVDAYTGTSIGGGVLKASKTKRITAGFEITDDSPFEGLDEALAESLAEDMLEKVSSWREVEANTIGLPVTFSVMAYDMNNQPIYLPAYDGKTPVIRSVTPAKLNATIEIDGVVMGSTETPIPLVKGIHKVRISHPGYDPLTLHITPREGMVVSVNLRMNQAEYNRIKDSIDFMHTLTKDREINQAKVKVLEGHAKELEQSGMRFDVKELPEQMIEFRSLL